MPKVTPLTTAEQLAKANADSDDALIIIVSARMLKEGKSKLQVAADMGMAPYTLRSRLQNPDTFTRGELRKLKQVLHLTDAESRMIAL